MSRLSSEDLGVVLPVQVVDDARADNLIVVCTFLRARTRSPVLVVEQGPPRAAALLRGLGPVAVSEDPRPDPAAPWCKARLLNRGLAALDTPFAAAWDADVLLDPAQILAGLAALRAGRADFVVPFDGQVREISAADLIRVAPRLDLAALAPLPLPTRRTGTGVAPTGGVNLARRDALRAAGGYCEHFTGWGREDDEVWQRVGRLGLGRARVAGDLLHLAHPRASTAGYPTNDALYARLAALDPAALRAEVAAWPWTAAGG
jgi:hypothetical protein